MYKEPSGKSLVEIIDDRPDVCFPAVQISESTGIRWASEGETIHQDESGEYYDVRADYVGTRSVDGEHIAILIADENDKNVSVSHPHPELPHLIGLYVREAYRSRGIASELVHEFMEDIGYDQCVVDCLDQVKPFYEQLDCEVIYLERFKG
jgi:ribosomal protein S18 acetylase RimI-like enzyme